MKPIRSLLKRGLEGVLTRPPLVRRRIAGRSGQILILAWHNIVPEGETAVGERSLHTDLSAFAAQLDILTATLPVVRLADVLRGAWPAERPAAVITFDDAYHGAVVAGGAELARRGLPSTVFVAPRFVGGRSFWWDHVAAATGELDADVRTRLLTELQGDDEKIRAELEGAMPLLPRHATAATEEELRLAANGGLMEFGSHTWSHRNFATLSAAERATELRTAGEWLSDRFDHVVPALALPYGLGVETAAEAAGPDCRAVLRIDGGWATPRAAQFQILPRLNVPRGLSPRGLLLRIAGFFA